MFFHIQLENIIEYKTTDAYEGFTGWCLHSFWLYIRNASDISPVVQLFRRVFSLTFLQHSSTSTKTVPGLHRQLSDSANGCLQNRAISEPCRFWRQLVDSVCMWVSGCLLELVPPLFLTLVLMLVYLLSGMWSYVRFNLSESTCYTVTWVNVQHTHTHTRRQTE